ncbi:MAG: endolytic transglycosylase MltG [Atribacterota bacterium]|nr:endolytic transglycosylase MltG [Atribacterota bacterium]
MKYRIINLLIFLFVGIFLVCTLVATWIYIPFNSVDPTIKALEIPFDYNSVKIRHLLEEEGIIRPYNIVFQLLTRAMKADGKLQSGEYQFSSSQNLLQIIEMLVRGKVMLHKITIPEGFQNKQIARLLEEKGIAEYEELMQLIQEDNEYQEGYLFPDTYTVPKNYGARNTLNLLVNNFKKIVFAHIDPEQEFPADLDFHQIVILASIIEKEAQGKDDKPKIASVFYNRLISGMRLQSCATVQYLLDEPKEELTYTELEIESPFNTYLNYGLPPAPICNPGLDSILAAAEPANEEYIFFVVGKEGEHVFSKTYEEHLDNKP